MFNTHTYFGTDGSLVASDQQGMEAALFTKYFGDSGAIGRVMGVSVVVTTEIKGHYEIGSRSPKELRSGNISIGGVVDRAYINGAMLKLMLGKYAESEEAAGFQIPTFNMKLILDNAMPPGDPGNSIINLFGVMFDSWQVSLPEDDFMLEHLTFKARRIAITDNEVS